MEYLLHTPVRARKGDNHKRANKGRKKEMVPKIKRIKLRAITSQEVIEKSSKLLSQY